MNISLIKIKNDLKKCLLLENFKIDFEENFYEWNVIISPNTEIFQQNYTFKLTIPTNFPFQAPKVLFISKVFHPNIDLQSGKPCIELLDNWNPKYTLQLLFNVILTMFQIPNIDNPVNIEASKLWNNKDLYKKKLI